MNFESINKLKEIELTEKIIIELKEWEPLKKFSKDVETIVGEVSNERLRDEKLNFFEKSLEIMRISKPNDGKLYLSQIIEKEKIKFTENNNLILSPVGSGKTTFIHEILSKDPVNCLMLVSNTALKNALSPEDDLKRKLKSNNTFTTKNKNVYGENDYKIHVMSYSEFGNKVKFNNDFIENIKYIFCDEIHSLPHFQSFNDSANLSHAIKTVFASYPEKKIFYFTATDEYLKDLEKNNPGVLRNIKTYDFRDHPEIKQYIPLSEYKFNHIEQVRPHLKARLKTFNYFGYKCLAFSRTIEGQKRIEEIAKEEGYVPLVLWSVNNKNENFKMTKEQLLAREYLLNNAEIPAPYNFLIINSSMQEGWDLHDKKVKLAIMNTTSETEKVQATGRLRNDIDILAYKVSKYEKVDTELVIPEEFLDTPLTNADKERMSKILNLTSCNGVTLKWRGVKDIILTNNSGYSLSEGTKTINNKRTRVTTISVKNDYE